jgi:hypothetical protein
MCRWLQLRFGDLILIVVVNLYQRQSGVKVGSNLPYPFACGFWEFGRPLSNLKLLSVKFELGPLQVCWKFSDL